MIRQITSLQYVKQSGKWRYLLAADLREMTSARWAWQSKKQLFCTRTSSGGELVLGTLHEGCFSIFPPYSSDGATFAPDFASIMRGVFFHDIMCQFCNAPKAPFTRQQADDYFLQHMEQASFPLRRLYYAGVRFGANFLQKEPNEKLYIRKV